VIEGRTWAMHEPQLRAMCEYLSGHVVGAEEVQALKGKSGAGKHGSVSVVGLHGVITPTPSLLAMLFGGGGGLTGFMEDMRAAIGDPDTSAVVIDIDSPGGMVDLVPETAAELRAMREDGGKPIVAVANTCAASAAYWIGAQAHELVVTPSGEVGSVGVFSVHRDMSRAFAEMGVKHTLVSAGAHKTEGHPYGALEDDAQDAMQQQIDDYYAMFVDGVAQGRGVEMPSLEGGTAFGGGRSYLAKRAVRAGLADREATLGETVRRLASGRARVRQTDATAGNTRGTLEVLDLEASVQYSKHQRLRLLDALTSR
jgi:capsid assembly protease